MGAPLSLEDLQANLLAFINVQIAKMKQSILETPSSNMSVVLEQFEATKMEEYMGNEWIRHDTLRALIHTLSTFGRWGVGGGEIASPGELDALEVEDFYYANFETNYEDWGVSSFPLLHIRSASGNNFTQVALPNLEGLFSLRIRESVLGVFGEWSSLSGGSGGGEMTAAQIAAKLDTFPDTEITEEDYLIGGGKKKFSVLALSEIIASLLTPPDESDPVFTNWLTNENKITTTEGTAVTVGGLQAGTNLADKNPIEVLDLILYPELWPTLTAPSSTFSITPSGLQEVGADITIVKERTFSRGSISPQYQSASPYRSGELVDYTETGEEGVYAVILGAQSWTSRANYNAGVQPKGSKGTNYGEPLSAGSTAVITRTITGVYPVYATTVNIGLLTTQALKLHGSDITVSMVAENLGKQVIRIPQVWGTITTLQQYNTLSGQWDTISLSTFTKTAVVVAVNGLNVNYWEYEHNGATIGARQLKFKV